MKVKFGDFGGVGAVLASKSQNENRVAVAAVSAGRSACASASTGATCFASGAAQWAGNASGTAASDAARSPPDTRTAAAAAAFGGSRRRASYCQCACDSLAGCSGEGRFFFVVAARQSGPGLAQSGVNVSWGAKSLKIPAFCWARKRQKQWSFIVCCVISFASFRSSLVRA